MSPLYPNARADPLSIWSGPEAVERGLRWPHLMPLSMRAILRANVTGTPCLLASAITMCVASTAAASGVFVSTTPPMITANNALRMGCPPAC